MALSTPHERVKMPTPCTQQHRPSTLHHSSSDARSYHTTEGECRDGPSSDIHENHIAMLFFFFFFFRYYAQRRSSLFAHAAPPRAIRHFDAYCIFICFRH
jgi:hypothetical protein